MASHEASQQGGRGTPSESDMKLVPTCDCNKIISMFRMFDNQKTSIVRKIGFDGLLKLPYHQRLNPELTLWLLKRVDIENMTLKLDGGIELALRNVDVHLILGIPFEGSVHYAVRQTREAVIAFKKKMTIDGSPPMLTLSFLEQVMQKEYDPDCTEDEFDALKIAIVMYSVCYFLVPEKSPEFPTGLICNFIPVVEPEKVNWAKLTIWGIRRAAAYVQNDVTEETKKIVLFGCSLLLQVFYLDNLNFGPSSPYHIVLPRSKIFDYDTVRRLIQMDTTCPSDQNLMQFGNAEVKQGFEVCYTRGWRDHLKLQSERPYTYQDSFLDSIEILSEGLTLFGNLDEQLSSLDTSKIALQSESIDERQIGVGMVPIDRFRMHNKETIAKLSEKASMYVKSCIIKLFSKHMPPACLCNIDIRKGSGTSTQTSSKRKRTQGTMSGYISPKPECKGRALRKIVMDRTSRLVGPPLMERSTPSSGPDGDGNVYSSAENVTISTKRKLLTTYSNFPLSCFDLMIDHPIVDKSDKIKTYYWVTDKKLPLEELERDWIVFNVPFRVTMCGHKFRECMRQSGSFSVTMFDAIMALWNYLDDMVLARCVLEEEPPKRWRHFLPASFAETVLRGGDYLNSSEISSSFIGDHITYNIADCQMIIVPVCTLESWSIYFWDFKSKRITVLDPALMKSCPTKSKERHAAIVSHLNKALFACKRQFFSGWDIGDDGWRSVYKTDLAKSCKVQNSGLYAAHYARAFTGDGLAFELKESDEMSLTDARGEIAYRLFACPANRGYKPMDLMDLVGL